MFFVLTVESFTSSAFFCCVVNYDLKTLFWSFFLVWCFSRKIMFSSVFLHSFESVLLFLWGPVWELQVIQMCFDGSSQPKNVLCFSLYMFYFLLSVNQKCALFSRLAFFTSQPKMCFVLFGMFFFSIFVTINRHKNAAFFTSFSWEVWKHIQNNLCCFLIFQDKVVLIFRLDLCCIQSSCAV